MFSLLRSLTFFVALLPHLVHGSQLESYDSRNALVLHDPETGIVVTKQDVLHYFSDYGLGRAPEAMDTVPNIEMAVTRLYAAQGILLGEAPASALPADALNWMGQQAATREQMKRYVDASIADSLASADWTALANEYFLVNRGAFLAEPEVRTRHILISTIQRRVYDAVQLGEELRNRVLSGEAFEAVAREYSEGPSAEKGGDLGFTKPGKLLPAFEEVAFAMQPGDISDLVITDYGVHIVQLIERREPRQQAFEEVRGQIEQRMRSEREVALRKAIILEQKLAAGADHVYLDTAWIEMLRNPSTRAAAIDAVGD